MSSAVNHPGGDDATTGDREVVASGDRKDPALGRREVVAREKEQFGGMRFGSAFFGWLAATGMVVLLTAVVAGTTAVTGIGKSINTAAPTTGELQTASIAGGVVLLAVVLIAYLCGGYVAGRMARFSGIKQGVAVWLWAVIIAIVVAILSAVIGSQFNPLANLSGVPAIPFSTSTLTVVGVATAVGLAIISLVGAILGGLAGMRFHRRVDRAGLGR